MSDIKIDFRFFTNIFFLNICSKTNQSKLPQQGIIHNSSDMIKKNKFVYKDLKQLIKEGSQELI